MKTSKYLEELKTQSAEQLNEQLVEAKKELFNLRFQNATNQLEIQAESKRFVRTSPEFRRLSHRRQKKLKELSGKETNRGRKKS